MPIAEHAGTALFLKRWLRRPLAMGAVVPSGRLLAEAMARTTLSVDRRAATAMSIELGAGTGEVTKALLAAGIAPASGWRWSSAIRNWPPSCAGISADRKIIEGDAARLSRLLAAHGIDKVAAVVSGLPLLSLPAEVVNGIVNGVFEALPRGAALVQFTYGPSPPVPRGLRASLRLVGAHGRRIWRNVPPAVVWTFRKPAA